MRDKVLEQPIAAFTSLQYQIEQSQNQGALFLKHLNNINRHASFFSQSLEQEYMSMVALDFGSESIDQLLKCFANLILNWSKVILKNSQYFQEEVIEPFTQFDNHLKEGYQKIQNDFQSVLDEVQTEREKLKRHKQQYFKLLVSQQQKKPIFENDFNKYKFQQPTEPDPTRVARQQYEGQIQVTNNVWNKLYNESPSLFGSFQLNHESLHIFMGKIIVQAVNTILSSTKEQPFHQSVNLQIKNIQDINRKNQNNQQLSLYESFLKSQNFEKPALEIFYIEKFPNSIPEKYIQMKKNQEIESQDEAILILLEHMRDQFLSRNYFHPPALPSSLYHKMKNSSVIQVPLKKDISEALLKIIQKKKTLKVVQLMDMQSIHLYKLMFNKLFNGFEMKYTDQKRFDKDSMIQFTYLVLLTLYMKFKPLSEQELRSVSSLITPKCNIFYNIQLWQDMFEFLCNEKDIANQLLKICKTYINEDIKMNCSVFLNNSDIMLQSNQPYIMSQLITKPKNWFRDQAKYFNLIKIDKNVMRDVLNIVNMLLIITNINSEFSSQIVMQLAKRQELTQSECLQYIELQEANQMQKTLKFKNKNYPPEKYQYKYGNKALYCLKKSLKYLDFESNFINITLINKEASINFRSLMMKYHVINGKIIKDKLRLKLWLKILVKKNNDLQLDYNQYEILQENNELDRRVEHSIDVDIKRSFNTSHSIKTPETQIITQKIEQDLRICLRAFSYSQPNISYFQGMNMLMAFFIYSSYTSGDLYGAYNLFNGLINQMLKEIFAHNLDNLKVHFYTLERLLAVYLPDLFKHWKQIKVESPQYATGWFVTLFTFGLQINEKISFKGENQVIFDIMDIIIAKKWQGFYEIVLTILNYYSPYLTIMEFDQTMNFLNNLAKSAFFYYPIQDMIQYETELHFPRLENIKSLAKSFNISLESLQEIKQEYYQQREKIDLLIYQCE